MSITMSSRHGFLYSYLTVFSCHMRLSHEGSSQGF
jgi:hypothetical protein